MIPKDCPQSNHDTAEPPFSHNGTHPHSSQTTPVDSDEQQYSDAYCTIKASLDAWEMWQELDTPGKLAVILTHYAAAQWLEPEELHLLASFRHMPPGKWAQIKLRYKEIGGSPHDLQCAVDMLLKVQPLQYAPQTVPAVPFQPISAAELHAQDLPPLPFLVEGLLPAGATLFVGRAKDGKSLLMWHLSTAVAEGGLAFGRYPTVEGDVLYLALEDGERRAKQRLIDQMQAMGMTTPPSRLSLVLWEAPRLGEGLEEALTKWLDEHSEARLIVIDILEKVRPRRTRNGSVYQEDYVAIAPLQHLAQERGIAIVIVHHANKGKAEDFRDGISGSMSLAGAADTLWVLHRLAGEADASLRIIGRDVETQELALQFQDGLWSVLGDAEEYRLSQASHAVLATLRKAATPMPPKQLAKLLGVPEATMRQRLKRMAERGEVRNLGDGRYVSHTMTAAHDTEDVTAVTPVTEVTPITPDTPKQAPTESSGNVTGSPEGCHADVTPVSPEKDSGLTDVSDSVTGVTGADALFVDRQMQPQTADHQDDAEPQEFQEPSFRCVVCGDVSAGTVACPVRGGCMPIR